MQKLVITGFLGITLLTGCASYSSGYQASTVQSRNVQLDPIVADIVVDESKKLIGKSESSYLLFIRLKGDNHYADGISYSSNTLTREGLFSLLNPFRAVERIATGDAEGKVKSAAAYDALDGSDADVLVHATYTIYKKNYLIYYVYGAEVQGYAGKYTNFRTESPLEERVNEIIANKVQFNIELGRENGGLTTDSEGSEGKPMESESTASQRDNSPNKPSKKSSKGR